MLSHNYLEMVCFASLFFPFYADELTTLVIRLHGRENLSQSHRRHLYQLLANELGIAHWKISSVYGAAQLIVGAGILIAYSHGAWTVLIFLAICFSGFTVVTAYVRKIAKKGGRISP